MTIEALQKRKAELQTQQAQLIANANAIGGAIQDIDYWIVALNAHPTPEPDTKS